MTSQSMHRAVVALLLAGVFGCAAEEPLPICISPARPPVDSSQPGILLVGQKARLRFEAIPPSVCTDPSTLATSVTAEIEGPGGEPLEGHAELESSKIAATVEFTPLRQGPHHVVVTFSQVGGLHQLDLHATKDRSAEAPPQQLSWPCNSLERTLQGAWVCDTRVLRGEATLATFNQARLAVSGDVIWVVDGSGIRRYVDTGTQLELKGSVAPLRGGAEFLVASPGELVVLHSSSNVIALYTFRNGALEAGPAESWSRPGLDVMTNGPAGVLLRDGERLLVGTRIQEVAGVLVKLCAYQLSSGRFQRTQEDCQLLPGEIRGFEPGVLWTQNPAALPNTVPSFGLITRWVWSGGVLTEQGSLSLNSNSVVVEAGTARPSVVPVLSPAFPASGMPLLASVVSWSAQKKQLLLETLDPALGNASASPSLYWGLTPSQTSIQARVRPPSQ